LVNPSVKNVADSNGVIDPTTFPYVFWQQVQSSYYDYFVPFTPVRIYTNISTMTTNHPLNSSIWNNGDVVYVRDQQIFIQYTSGPSTFTDVTSTYKAAVGRNNLNYIWQHFADSSQRIDPAIMNVIDIYVLTTSYDTALRNWIANNGSIATEPSPPSPEDLRTTFSNLENYKMMTDQIIWHPVSYKLLFGQAADPELQVSFKVVKNQNSNITDSELKSSIINNIDNYFSINNWNFGDSFYFTELAAYIHQQNPTTISSIVILPLNANSAFGDLFEIQCAPDEIFISCAKVTDIQIVQSLTPSQLRIA
jgi:hypothetical protein